MCKICKLSKLKKTHHNNGVSLSVCLLVVKLTVFVCFYVPLYIKRTKVIPDVNYFFICLLLPVIYVQKFRKYRPNMFSCFTVRYNSYPAGTKPNDKPLPAVEPSPPAHPDSVLLAN